LIDSISYQITSDQMQIKKLCCIKFVWYQKPWS